MENIEEQKGRSLATGVFGKIFELGSSKQKKRSSEKIRRRYSDSTPRKKISRERVVKIVSKNSSDNEAAMYEYVNNLGLCFVPYLHEIITERELRAFVLERMDEDLVSFSQRRREKESFVQEIKSTGQEVTRMLEELHKNGILHRDIKPRNIMIR